MMTSGNAGEEREEHMTIEEQMRRRFVGQNNNTTIKQFAGVRGGGWCGEE